MWGGVVAATGQNPDAEGIDFRWGGFEAEEEEEVEEVIDYANLTHPRKEQEKILRFTMSTGSYHLHCSSPKLCGTSEIPKPDAEWVAEQRRAARRRAKTTKSNHQHQHHHHQQGGTTMASGSCVSVTSEEEEAERRREQKQQEEEDDTAGAFSSPQRHHHSSLSPEKEREITDVIDSRIQAMSSTQVKSTSWSEVAGRDRELVGQMMQQQQERIQKQSHLSAARRHPGIGSSSNNTSLVDDNDDGDPQNALVDEETLTRRRAAAAILHRSGHQGMLPDLPGFRTQDEEGQSARHLEQIGRRHHVEAQEALKLKIKDLVGTCKSKLAFLEAEQAAGGPAPVPPPIVEEPFGQRVERQRAQLESRHGAGLAALKQASRDVANDATAAMAVQNAFSFVASSSTFS